jgi:peptidoglycan/LPS O-acetylase OafA/YrhL
MTPTSRRSSHIASIDGLRGIAAVAVLILHIDGKILNGLIDPSYAHLAVDFFFMLSGFVVAQAYEQRLLQGLTVSTFAAIRLRRLYPMIFLGVVVGATILAMRSFIKKDIDIESVGIAAFWALLLLPWETKGRPGDLYPLNAAHWSLFFELVINFVYGGLVKYLNNRVLIAVCFFSFVGLFYVVSTNGYSLAELGSRPPTFLMGYLRVTFPFSVGVLLFRLNPSPPKIKRDLGPLLCAILFAVLVLPFFPKNWYSELLVVGLVFPPLVLLGVRCPNVTRSGGALLWLGELSYPLYATHEPLIRLSINAAEILKWGEHAVVVGIICFAASIAFAIASYSIWDQPAREWLKRDATVTRLAFPDWFTTAGVTLAIVMTFVVTG